MRQLELTAPYAKGSDTSKAAAESVQSSTSSLRARILDWVTRRGAKGATCDEIEVASGMRHQTASARCKELRDMGVLVDSGERRPTRSGRKAAVLKAV